jgi:hypothetical protein
MDMINYACSKIIKLLNTEICYDILKYVNFNIFILIPSSARRITISLFYSKIKQ